MGFFEKPGGFGKKIEKGSKGTIKKIASGAMAAGAIFLAADAEAGSSTGEYEVDKSVVGQEGYKIPGVIEKDEIPGVVKEGEVEGAIKDDGQIYRKKEKTPQEYIKPKKVDLRDMRRGGKIEIDGKTYNIEK